MARSTRQPSCFPSAGECRHAYCGSPHNTYPDQKAGFSGRTDQTVQIASPRSPKARILLNPVARSVRSSF